MNISVIIPALNEAEMIDQTIRQVQDRATGHVAEIVVADGGSRDATRAHAENAGATVFKTKQKGRARQMNEGAEQAAGALLYFLHADTIPPDEFDRQLIEAVHNGHSAGCFRLGFDRDHPLLNFYSWCTRFDLDAFRFGDQSLFMTRELFDQVGGFDESLIVMEDNMMVRAIKKEARFRILHDEVTTSARKYERVGIVRLQLIFMLIYLLFFAGLPQKNLVSTYRALISK